MERKNFDSVTVFGEKYLKTKTNCYSNKININLKKGKNNSTNPTKEGSKYICLSAIVIDSLFKLGKNYYPQTFLEK